MEKNMKKLEQLNLSKVLDSDNIIPSIKTTSPTSHYAARVKKLQEDHIGITFEDKARDLIGNSNLNDLKSVDTSLDNIVVRSFNNERLNQSDIVSFNSLEDPFGTKESKVIAIKLINQIKEKDFRLTEEGEKIYNSFIEFKGNININRLESLKFINFDKETIDNTVNYVMIACDIEHINSIIDLSTELNKLMSSTNVLIPQEIKTINVDSLIDENKAEIEKVVEDNDKKITKLQSETKSFYDIINKTLMKVGGKLGITLLGSCLGGPVVMGIGTIIFRTITTSDFTKSDRISPTIISTPTREITSSGEPSPISAAIAEVIRYWFGPNR